MLLKGDVKFAEVLEKMGAKVTWSENSVTVTGPPRSAGRKHLRAVDVNMNKMPDVAMTLAVVALFADGPTAIRDGTFGLALFFAVYWWLFTPPFVCSFLLPLSFSLVLIHLLSSGLFIYFSHSPLLSLRKKD